MVKVSKNLSPAKTMWHSVKLKSVSEDLLLSVERNEWGYLCLSVTLDTKQAPQSWIGRFNKVIGWGVSRYYCCSEVDWVWMDEKGVLKSGWEVIDESGDWTEVDGDKEGLWVMSYEWWVMSDELWVMSDEGWWWWRVLSDERCYRLRKGCWGL